MNFKKWVKSIQTAGYIGACTEVYVLTPRMIKQFDFWLQVLAKFWPQSAQIKFKFLKADNLVTYPEKWGKCTKLKYFLFSLQNVE